MQLKRLDETVIAESVDILQLNLELKRLIEYHKLDLQRADLPVVNLYGADLAGADFTQANLVGTNFCYADLRGAKFNDAKLYAANFMRADLSGVDFSTTQWPWVVFRNACLQDITVNWQSHALLAELLRQAAAVAPAPADFIESIIGSEDYYLRLEEYYYQAERESIERLKIAGLVLLSEDKCWDWFLKWDDPQKQWALDTLRKYVKPGDGAPKCLQ